MGTKSLIARSKYDQAPALFVNGKNRKNSAEISQKTLETLGSKTEWKKTCTDCVRKVPTLDSIQWRQANLNDIPETRYSIIARLSDAEDRQAWEHFAEHYRPVIYRIARRRGIQDADAQDLTQRVLAAIANSIGDWQPKAPGAKFRHWLRRVAKNETLKFLTRQPHDRARGGTSVLTALHAAPAEDQIEQEIERETRRQLIRRAAKIVREQVAQPTWQAFALTMIEGQSIEDSANALGLNIGSIYAARSRILKRIRETVRQLEQED